jgi:hypothetical protein
MTQDAGSVAGYCPHGEPYDDKDPCPDDPPRYAESVEPFSVSLDGHREFDEWQPFDARKSVVLSPMKFTLDVERYGQTVLRMHGTQIDIMLPGINALQELVDAANKWVEHEKRQAAHSDGPGEGDTFACQRTLQDPEHRHATMYEAAECERLNDGSQRGEDA